MAKKTGRLVAASAAKKSIAGTRAIRRTCLILREIAAARDPGASLPQLVVATAMPKSSVHRYVEVLLQEGFLERNEAAGTYRLGAGFGTRETQLLVARARPFLERLRDRFNETVNFGMLSGDNVVYLDILESARTVRLAARVGDQDMVHSTALGKAIAAELPTDEVRALLKRTGLRRRTANTITRLAEFVDHLELVRRHGFALDDQENDMEGRCVAVAVPAPRVQFAISVSGITSRFPMSKALEAAREIRQVIVELGGQARPPHPVTPYP